jgi:hypothetical protein
MPQLRTDSFYRELAERLGPVMPAHVTISHDARFPSLTLAGHSGNSGRLFPTLFIRGRFRIRLRLSAKLILRDVQRFAVIELHRPWPGEPGRRRLTVAYVARRNTGLAQHAQTVQLAGRLDDAGQHQLTEHLVPAHGLLEPEHPVGMDQDIHQMPHPRPRDWQRAAPPASRHGGREVQAQIELGLAGRQTVPSGGRLLAR